MMDDNKMNDNKMPGADASVVGTVSEQPLQFWVSPSFERIPLNEAMGAGPNLSVTDGGSLYS